ncbi:MAG: PEP-CTERM-box response regulator transcription factor [Parvularculaceae bacterium]
MSEKASRLLIVDDDLGIQKQLKWNFEGWEVSLAANRDEALAAMRRLLPPVVTLDLGLPPHTDSPVEGFATLEGILEIAPDTKVIVVSGQDDQENAVRAIGLGAYDFCAKPIDPTVLSLIVERADRVYQLEAENRRLRRREDGDLAGFITANAETQAVCAMVKKVAPTEVAVLLLGESGTGKELLARGLHENSQRAQKPFIPINCAAIPDNLLESELFGFEKGAFTGAVKQTKGILETANSGTVFLDEIGDLPLSLQAKLLRFLQERTIERIGGRESISVDVRIIAATHKDLKAAIANGEFREDLFYRLSEIVVEIPPLRERGDDAIVLARSFLQKYASQHKRRLKGFTKEALAAIAHHPWPGNVRELENRLKRAVILAEDEMITSDDLQLHAPGGAAEEVETLRAAREAAETRAIERALAFAQGNVSKAAKILGVSRPTLYDLARQYDLQIDRFKGAS